MKTKESFFISLLLVFILASVTKGAKLALDLGFFSFQPMEFVKILFVMFVASAFHKANNLKTVIITAICAAIHVLIVVFYGSVSAFHNFSHYSSPPFCSS